jgi:hypothetical protein
MVLTWFRFFFLTLVQVHIAVGTEALGVHMGPLAAWLIAPTLVVMKP